MSEHESRARHEAERREWTIERRDLEIGALGVPCFVAPNTVGECHIWVGTASNSDELKAVHDWQQGALHTASIRGLFQRKVVRPIWQGVDSRGDWTISFEPCSFDQARARL